MVRRGKVLLLDGAEAVSVSRLAASAGARAPSSDARGSVDAGPGCRWPWLDRERSSVGGSCRDHALGVRVLPWRPFGGQDLGDTHAWHAPSEGVAVDSSAIAEAVPGSGVLGVLEEQIPAPSQVRSMRARQGNPEGPPGRAARLDSRVAVKPSDPILANNGIYWRMLGNLIVAALESHDHARQRRATPERMRAPRAHHREPAGLGLDGPAHESGANPPGAQ